MFFARIFCVFFGTLCLSWPAMAQISQEKLTCLQRAIEELGSFETQFKQETYSDFFDPTLATGVLQVHRPGKMRMDYLEGERKHVIWDGTTCYERDEMADSESRTLQDEIKDEPLVRLLLYGEELQSFFMVRNGKSLETKSYQLTPRNGDAYTLYIELNNNCEPTFLDIQFEDGEGTRLWFREIKPKTEFPADTFVVPKPS